MNKIYSNKNKIYSNKNKIYRNTHVNIQKSTTVLADPEDVDSWEDPRFARCVCEFSVED